MRPSSLCASISSGALLSSPRTVLSASRERLVRKNRLARARFNCGEAGSGFSASLDSSVALAGAIWIGLAMGALAGLPLAGLSRAGAAVSGLSGTVLPGTIWTGVVLWAQAVIAVRTMAIAAAN